MESVTGELLAVIATKLDEVCAAVTNVEKTVASVRTELKEDMKSLEMNLKNEIKIQIEKSNNELSEYMVEDIIPILNDLDMRLKTLEQNQINVVAEENAEYDCDTKK